jgi:DNA-binding transcriptional MerR regulator
MQGTIPDKIFFKIREVVAITGIKPYVLRYWESEFSSLNPQKSRGGQRIYKRKDIETILEIKKLVYEEGYTIAGANKLLAIRTREEPKQLKFDFDRTSFFRVLRDLRNELRSLLSLMGKGEGGKAKDLQDNDPKRKIVTG